MENWYAICLNEWIFDPRIKNELNLLLYISSLSAERWYCFASNWHLSEKFWIHEVNISRKLKKLSDLWLLRMDYKMKDRQIISREIFIIGGISKNAKGVLSKMITPLIKNAKDNSTSINITSINNGAGGNLEILEKKKSEFSPWSTRYVFFDFLETIEKTGALEQVLDTERIEAIEKKLQEFRSSLGDNRAKLEIESFIAHHTTERTKFRNIILRLNTWLIISTKESWKSKK